MVVVYHLYPSVLPGGFAGVDVFFVISGFLITGHMWREYRKKGTIALVSFWGRRAKRLIPASALVLAVTWGLSYLLLPVAQLATVATQIRASALYFQNWELAREAVNYLTQNNAPTPVQHFWSLSVEEQFYLVWPLLFVIATIFARGRKNADGSQELARGTSPHYRPRDRWDDKRWSRIDPPTAPERYTNHGARAGNWRSDGQGSWEYRAHIDWQNDPGLTSYDDRLISDDELRYRQKKARNRSEPSTWRATQGGVRGYGIIWCLTSLLVLVSLAYSYYDTKANPSSAYFVTTTRLWELGFGGLLALLPAKIAGRLGSQGWLSWVGLALTLASLLVLRASTPFPGVYAILPVAGAVLLIGCGSAEVRFGTARLTSLRPLVWLGGISYSLYLWHFPIFTLWVAWQGKSIGYAEGPFLVLVAVLLAWLTKVFVEDKVRQARFFEGRQWRSISTALAAVVPAALATVFLVSLPGPWNGNLGPGYPGGAVLAGKVSAPQRKPILPPLSEGNLAMAPQYWQDGCLVAQLSPTPKVCTYGDTADPKLTVALVGDSMVGNWFPALNTIAKSEHWKLITEIHGDCAWTATLMWYPDIKGPYHACQQWGASVLQDLLTKLHPNVVITSGRQSLDTPDHTQGGSAAQAEIGSGEATYWRDLKAHGISVIPIRETPEWNISATQCISAHPSDYMSACSFPTATSITKDSPITYAVARLGGKLSVVDMNSLICTPATCAPVVGNVLVRFDQRHMTTAYSQTLAPFLLPKLLAASPVLRRAES